MSDYNTLNQYYRNRYGRKVYKLAVNIGGTCPNRDGTKGVGGCIFCGESGSGEYSQPDIDSAIGRLKDKACGSYVLYLQAYSNTYRSVSELDNVISAALKRDDIVGVSIATRADCFSDDMWDYLGDLNARTDLTVELGLQTARDDIADYHNCGHSYAEFESAFYRLKSMNIRVVVHIINGLIGESREDMLNTITKVANLRPGGVKIHCLFVAKGTRLEELYNAGLVKVLEKDEYVDIVAEQIARLPKSTVVERVTGDCDRRSIIAPLWTLNKRSVLNDIAKAMRSEGIKQGDLLNEKHD